MILGGKSGYGDEKGESAYMDALINEFETIKYKLEVESQQSAHKKSAETERNKKKTKKGQKTSTPQKPMPPHIIKVIRFSSKLSFFATNIRNREFLTMDRLREKKFTKKELLEDIDELLYMDDTIRKRGQEIINADNDLFADMVKDSFVAVRMITSPLYSSRFKIYDVDEKKSRELMYKYFHRGYKQANRHCEKLDILSARIAEEAHQYLEFLDLNSGTVPEKTAETGQKTSKVKDTEKNANEEKKQFSFNEGQAFYKGKDLGLSTGAELSSIEILKKLVNSLGKVVKYKILDKNSQPNEASVLLRGKISNIRSALKNYKVPYEINTKKWVGYVLSKS
jgi:hypothetical protein